MTHEAVRDKLLDLAYGELSRREERQVEEHAAGCDACRAELERIRDTRRLVSALPPVEAPEHGVNVLLAAARERARLREPRWQVPRWFLGASVAAASIAVVAAVSYRIIAMRPGPLGGSEHDALLGEARPKDEALAAVKQQPAAADESRLPHTGGGEGQGVGVRSGGAEQSPARRGEVVRERELAKPFRDGRGEAPLSAPSPAGGALGKGTGAPRADVGQSPLPRTGGGEGPGVGVVQRFAEPPPAAAAPEPPAAVRSEAFGKKRAAEAEASASAREEAPDDAVAAAPRAPAAPERPESRVRAAPPAPVAKAAPSRSAAKASSPAPPAPEAAQPGYSSAFADRAEAPAEKDAVAQWESLRAEGKLSVEVRRFSGCDPERSYDPHHFDESFRKLERDPEGRLVRYEMHGRFDDGAPFRAEGFYDASGALRVERWRFEGSKPTEKHHPPGGPRAKTWFPAQAGGVRIDAPGLCER